MFGGKFDKIYKKKSKKNQQSEKTSKSHITEQENNLGFCIALRQGWEWQGGETSVRMVEKQGLINSLMGGTGQIKHWDGC